MKKALGNAPIISKKLGIKTIKELADEWVEKEKDMSKKEAQDFSNSILMICYKVWKELGSGLTENIYENAICMELQLSGIKYTQQEVITINYNGYNIGNIRADICIPEYKLCLELKAIDNLYEKNRSQIVQQIKNLNYRHGVLFNFEQTPNGKKCRWYYIFKDTEEDCYYSYDLISKTNTKIFL